jgi:hypothetical protein
MNKLLEVGRCNCLVASDKGLPELLEENAFFLQARLQHIRQVLRAEAEFEQRLIVLPTADAGEYRDKQRKEQRHRQGDIGRAAAPQGARLAEEPVRRCASEYATHRLSSREPRNVAGSVAAPAISIAETAIPAGGNIAVAYPGGTASRRPSRPVST